MNIKQKFRKTNLSSLIATLVPKWFNIRICSIDGHWNDYFKRAQLDMDEQWDKIIWPIIKDFDFKNVLELAPGGGRNTEKLAKFSGIIHAVDLNDYALEHLKKRFHNYKGNCRFYFHKNNGNDLGMIKADSITAIYCWDAAVHFDKSVMRDYIKEFSRVLKAGGRGFIHYSSLGQSAKSDIRKNPHWRSNMDKDLFGQYCEEYGLQVIKQFNLAWREIPDCISVFQKEKFPSNSSGEIPNKVGVVKEITISFPDPFPGV